jgi:RNA polymerase sigma-70 factor (ECF subfamily)
MPLDEELMLAAGAGDLEAFEQIVLRHQKSAWNTAHRFLGEVQEAEDVVQEAFMKILEAAGRYRPSASFRTYLYRIVVRLCLDRVRKKAPLYTDTPPEPVDPAPGVSEDLLAVERDQAVRSALNKLPDNQRTAIILKYYEGLGYSDIAEVLEVSEKAVERLLARGRDSLGKYLKNYGEK